MRFFKLEDSVDAAEIGIHSQVQKVKPNNDPALAQRLGNIPLEGPIEHGRRFPDLLLAPRAKWTDFLNLVPGSGDFRLVSPRTLDIMREHKMDDYQSYELSVSRGTKTQPYHLLRFVHSRNSDYVDWQKSVFGHTTKMWRELIAEIQFNDYDSFLKFMKESYYRDEHLIVRKLFLRDSEIKVDSFRLFLISTGVYVSERLKDAFQKEGITGRRFVPLEDLGERVLKEMHPHMFEQKS
jgi:hypothetical protein